MQNIKKPLLLKLIIRIALPIVVIYSLVLWFNYSYNKKNAISKTKKYLAELTKQNAEKLDKDFRQIAQSANSIKNFVEASYPVTEESIFEFVKKEVDSDKDNIGSGVAFLPYKFNNKTEKYANFINRIENKYKLTDISKLYNYLLEDWFVIPSNLKKEYWSEPFWGKVSQTLLMLNAKPIYSNNEQIGVCYADISLADLSKLAEGNEILGGYTFIISKQGTFIYHPNKNYVMKETIFSLAEQYNKPELRILGRKMINKQQGITNYQDIESENKKWLVYSPIKSTGWSFAAVIPEKAILAPVKQQAIKQIVIMLVALLIILAIIVFVAKSITKPIKNLALAANEIAEGKLDTKLTETNAKDEISALSFAFNKMTLDLKQYIENVTSITKAKEAVESEMRIARTIQESLLPRIFPAFPDRKEFDLYAKNIAAKEVAGDFYDFFFLDDETIALIIADVSGKGISAGLFMAVTRTLLKTVCSIDVSPDKALTKTNEILCQDNDACMFTTLFLGYYNVNTGKMQYSNAGHDYPYVLNANGECKVIKGKQDIALGIDEDHIYQLNSASIATDEVLVLYTDGVIEATNPEKELFGEDRFKQLLCQNSTQNVKRILDISTDELLAFQKQMQFDDITLLAMKRTT